MTEVDEQTVPVDSEGVDLRYSRETVGLEEPVRRSNNAHPVTGKKDDMRQNRGDRYRIENLEFENGHLICGKMNPYTGEYCKNVPMDNGMRCEEHYSKTPKSRRNGTMDDHPYSPSIKYGMELNAFLHCRTCKKTDCPYFTNNREADECVIERYLYEQIMNEAKDRGIDETSMPFKYRMIQMLAWDVVKNFRAENIIAKDGFTISEVSGYKAENGDIGFLYNTREHPVLKHMPKFQESIIKLGRELEITPKAETQKQGTEEDTRHNDLMEEMLRNAHKLREEGTDNK